MNRPAALALAILAAGTAAAPVAQAAPKPAKKTYTATAPNPDPTNFADRDYSVCAQNVPGSFHIEQFKVPAAGTLKVELTKYQGDWDLLLMDGKNQELAYGGAIEPGAPEIAQVKFKRAGLVKIVACNWAGGPTGEVTYNYTPKK